MKKIIKNILLTFVIIYTVSNLILYASNLILKYSIVNEALNIYTGENRNSEEIVEAENGAKYIIEHFKEIYGDDIPGIALLHLQGYTMGMNLILERQTLILLIALILSVTIGIIVSLTEKSKIKEVLYFILGAILFILLITVYMMLVKEYQGMNFIEASIETIGDYTVYYIIGYLVIFIYRYYLKKKEVNELNKEIKTKNK